MNYAIRYSPFSRSVCLSNKARSGIAITSGYAVGQCSRFLKVRFLSAKLIYKVTNWWFQTVDNDEEFHELQGLQIRLDSKIRVSYLSHVMDKTGICCCYVSVRKAVIKKI